MIILIFAILRFAKQLAKTSKITTVFRKRRGFPIRNKNDWLTWEKIIKQNKDCSSGLTFCEWQRFTSFPRRVFRPTDDFGGNFNYWSMSGCCGHRRKLKKFQVKTSWESWWSQNCRPRQVVTQASGVKVTAKIISWPEDASGIRRETLQMNSLYLFYLWMTTYTNVCHEKNCQINFRLTKGVGYHNLNFFPDTLKRSIFTCFLITVQASFAVCLMQKCGI